MDVPVLVYDDDCSFCTRVAHLLDRHGRVDVVGFSDVEPALERRLPAGYRSCVHLVTDETVYSCGEAVERALSTIDGVPEEGFAFLRSIPGYSRARERGYDLVAENRGIVGRLVP